MSRYQATQVDALVARLEDCNAADQQVQALEALGKLEPATLAHCADAVVACCLTGYDEPASRTPHFLPRPIWRPPPFPHFTGLLLFCSGQAGGADAGVEDVGQAGGAGDTAAPRERPHQVVREAQFSTPER